MPLYCICIKQHNYLTRDVTDTRRSLIRFWTRADPPAISCHIGEAHDRSSRRRVWGNFFGTLCASPVKLSPSSNTDAAR
jgi:hypothetical protein